eukprot:g8723.t1
MGDVFRNVGQMSEIRHYLITQELPMEKSRAELKRFKTHARQYFVQNDHLYKRRGEGLPQRVAENPNEQQEIIRHCHEGPEKGHRKRDATFLKVKERYFWPKMYSQIDAHIKSCKECQMRSNKGEVEPLKPLPVGALFDRVHMDFVGPLPRSYNCYYILVAREHLSGWVKAKGVRRANAKSVVKFIEEELIGRHGMIRQLTVDRGTHFLNQLVKEVTNKWKIKLVPTTPYYPEGNGLVERGHKPLIDSLVKWCHEHPTSWMKELYAALLADRVTVKRTTGFTPFKLVYGRECVLPIELIVTSFQTESPENDKVSTQELLELRMKQILTLGEDWDLARENIETSREVNKNYFDSKTNIRTENLKVGEFVLLKNIDKHQSKFSLSWLGPYKITNVYNNGAYEISEIDGSILHEAVSGSRLKRFYTR